VNLTVLGTKIQLSGIFLDRTIGIRVIFFPFKNSLWILPIVLNHWKLLLRKKTSERRLLTDKPRSENKDKSNHSLTTPHEISKNKD